MQLTRFTDYAFRTLIHLAAKQGPGSLSEIAEAYGISRNHLIKAVNVLEKNGFVKTRRGVGGGITLARDAGDINLLDVARCTEPGFTLVECFDAENDRCVISGSCALQGILGKALKAFMDELARYSLADVMGNRKQLVRLLHLE